MILTAKGKFIDTKPMERLLTQGEKYADKIHFVLPAINNDVNIVNCSFVIRTVASDGSMTETGLTAQRSIEQVLLTWDVPESVTAVAGMLQMELVGIKDSDIIIKYKMPAIFIKGAVMGDHLPPPDIIEEKLAQMNDILRQAQGKLDEAKDMVVNISSDIIDKTLAISDKAADAKITGDRLEGLSSDITDLDELVKGILTNISSGGIAQSMIEVINARTSPGLKGRVFDSLSDRLKEEFSEKVDFGAFWANMDDIAQQFVVDEKEVKDARISPGLDDREFNSLSERLESEFFAANEKTNSLLSQMETTSEIASDAQYKANLLHSQVDDIRGNIDGTQFLGNSNTATKLQTARQINGTAFDGSKDINIPIKGCYAYDESTTASTAPWHKVASCTLTKGSEDAYAVFHVYRTLSSTFPGGILKARIRTNTDVTLQSCNLLWEYANNINKEDFILCIIQDQNSKTLTAELWVSITARWIGYQFTMIADTDRTSIRSDRWTLYNSSVGQAAYTESYKTINSEFSPIQNPVELSDSGWTRMTISGGNGELYYRKCGKTVELKGSASPNADNEWTVCTLPDGYRPSTASVDVIVMGNSPRKLSISTQGVVTVSNVTAHEAIRLQACFLVD